MLAFAGLPYLLRLLEAGGNPILVVGSSLVIVVLFVLLLFVANLMSPGLRTWIKLDGRCPVCLNWRFARGKADTTETCAKCGAEIIFEWSE